MSARVIPPEPVEAKFCKDSSKDVIFISLSTFEGRNEKLERRAELMRQEEVADIVRRWELADRRDRWKHTSEARPKASAPPEPTTRAYRTPQSTIDAFKYVVRLGDAEYLERWVRDHQEDAPALLKILDGGKR